MKNYFFAPIRNRNFIWAACFRSLHIHQPLAGLRIRHSAHFFPVPGSPHSDFLSGIRLAENGGRCLLLEHHIVANYRRQDDFRIQTSGKKQHE